MFNCPRCRSSISFGAHVCTQCGLPLSWSTSNATPQAPLQNTPIQQYASVSPYASQSNAPWPDGTSQSSSKNKSHKVLWIVLAIVLVLLLAGGALWYFFFFDRGEENANGKKTVLSSLDYTNLRKAIDELPEVGELKLISSDVSEYPKVKLYVQVKDSQGNDLELSSPTAAIKERVKNGTLIERKIRSIERVEDNEGVGFELLIDKSGSMEWDFPQMQEAVRDFINSLNYQVGDKAEIISFDTYLMYMASYTGQKDLLLNGINNMTPYGQTALYDALYTGVQNAGNRLGSNCVVAFTDGIDNESMHTYSEVISLAQEKEIPIYLIGTDGADSSVLTEISQTTGGEFWSISSIPDMSDVFAEINSTQKNLYALEYESDTDLGQYDSREIDVVIIDGSDAQHGASSQKVSFTPVEKKEIQKHTVRYEIEAADVSWTAANDSCVAKGGHLATVTDQDEQNEMISLAQGAGLQFVWLGGYTSVRNGSAFGHWVTGEPFDYTAWYPGEPSRNDRDGTPESYVMLWNVENNWSWNDQRNDPVNETGLAYFRGKTGYICEYEQ